MAIRFGIGMKTAARWRWALAVAFTDDDGWGVPFDPLLYIGGGMGIPWEDDETSAALSWSSNFQRQVHFCPFIRPDQRKNDVFFFLAFGAKSEVFPNFWNQKPTALPPPSAPFEATPWQRARDLYLRRPDLDFH